MRVDQMADDREPESRSSLIARAAGVHPIEPLEDARYVLGRDADPRIAHVQPDPGVAEARPKSHGAVVRIAHGVLHQVAHHLAKRCRIGVHDGGAGWHVGDEAQPLRVGGRAHGREHVLHACRHVHVADIRAPAAALDARKIEQVVHDALHAPRIVPNGLHEPATLIARDVLVEQCLGEPAHGGERCLQLVTDVGHEVAPDGLQLPQHGEVEDRHHGARLGERS